MKKIGVLALQGDFEAHHKALERLGVRPSLARTAEDLNDLDGLVIPGGESTTMWKLLDAENLREPLSQFGRTRHVFGTCAGAILMASQVANPSQQSLGLMDIGVERNGYGRQIDSRVAHLEPSPEFERRTHSGHLEAVFIRAPIIRRVGREAKVLATYRGDPVLVEQGPHLAATFHPELTADSRVHELFLAKL